MLFMWVWIPRMYLKYVTYGGRNHQLSANQIELMNRNTYGNAAIYIWTILTGQGLLK